MTKVRHRRSPSDSEGRPNIPVDKNAVLSRHQRKQEQSTSNPAKANPASASPQFKAKALPNMAHTDAFNSEVIHINSKPRAETSERSSFELGAFVVWATSCVAGTGHVAVLLSRSTAVSEPGQGGGDELRREEIGRDGRDGCDCESKAGRWRVT